MRKNYRLTAFAAALCLAALGTGCATTTAPQQAQLDRLQSIAQVAAYTGAAIYLSDKPETRPAFVSARAGVAALVAQQNFDPTQLAMVLASNLPIKDLKSDKATIVITAASLLYQTALGSQQIEKPAVVQAFATGILQGLDMALLAAPQ